MPRRLAVVWLCACGAPEVPRETAAPPEAPATIREALGAAIARGGCGQDEGEPALGRAVYGDLDGDGREDAIAVVRCTGRWTVHVLDAYAMRDVPTPVARSVVRVLGD